MTDSSELGLEELGAAYRAGTTNPAEVLRGCLTRIEQFDPALGAFTYLDTAAAVAAADRLGRELASGRSRGPLHGVPIAVKELFDVSGSPADYGSLIRSGLIAGTDSVAVSRLRAAGAVIVGLTRSHEFGWGITTQHGRRGSTRNPWNRERIPGGSSGGAAAAVAAGLVSAAIATDTGGSIRIPSAFCGIAGIKPTFGRVARTGLVPLAPSFDTAGVLAGSVRDLAPVLDAISGPDAGDPDSVTAGLEGSTAPTRLTDLTGVRLGHPPRDDNGGPAARDRFDRLLARAGNLGAELVEVVIPDRERFRDTFATIQAAEAFDVHSHVLGLYPAQADGYGDDVRGRLEAGSRIGIEQYLDATRARGVLTVELAAALRDVDAFLAPIAPVGPPDVSEPDLITSADAVGYDGVRIPLRDAVMGFVVPYNLTGRPSVAFRAGFDDTDLPWGAQVVAAHGAEATALAVADALERSNPDHTRRPEMT
jgi:aspartyl-tRNA(Asn)/glutamyl-tRNA(Gln) amidotransferase subunit A